MATHYQTGDEPVLGSGYRLREFIGRGGFGEVWRAGAPGGAEAALKIIHLGGTEGRKEFHALQLVKRIRHANLVPITAFWLKTADGRVLDDALTQREDLPRVDTAAVSVPAETPVDPLRETMEVPPELGRDRASELIIAMGLGDQSLSDRLDECRAEGLEGIPLAELLDYMEGAARAIDFLNSPTHDLGAGPNAAIQHCDIKPQNIMIVGGVTQVCDFGLARLMGTDRTTTAAATIAYAAPECLVEGVPSASTDQYSLAVSYFELRTGALPFSGETLAAIIDAKRHGGLGFSRLPKAEQAVLRRATSDDPDKRYPSAMDMVKALRDATTKAPEQPKRPVGRAVALVVAVGIIAFGIVFLLRQWPPSPRERAKACLARGTDALKQEDYAKAIVELQQASKYSPNDARISSRLGAAWFGRQEWQKAVENFSTALEIEPSDTDHLGRGRAYRELGEINAAVADFQKAAQLNPQNAAAHVALGGCCLDGEDFDGAIEHFGRAIRVCSETPDSNFPIADAYVLRASAHLASEPAHLDLAAADFAKAIQLGDPRDLPNLHGLLGLLAKAYARQGRFSDAVKSAEKAVKWATDKDATTRHRTALKKYKAAKP